jgi:hypothetical protein
VKVYDLRFLYKEISIHLSGVAGSKKEENENRGDFSECDNM